MRDDEEETKDLEGMYGAADYEVQEEEDFEIRIQTYNKNDVREIKEKFLTGQSQINSIAACQIFQVIVKTLKDLIEVLNTIMANNKIVTFQLIRVFILKTLHFSGCEEALYAAL